MFLEKKPAGKKGETYPIGNPSNMQFDLLVRNSTHRMGWAYSELITLGDKFNDQYVVETLINLNESGGAVGTSSVSTPENSLETKAGESRTMNVSYKIMFTLNCDVKFGDIIATSSNFSGRRGHRHRRVEISAEGIYDAKA